MFLESITGDVVAKALDVSAFNHKVIANNIANAGVKNFTPGRINFNDVMQEVRKLAELDADKASYENALESINEKNMVVFAEQGQEVLIDREMLSLAENTIRYQSLLRARSELGEILKSAIAGGGRG